MAAPMPLDPLIPEEVEESIPLPAQYTEYVQGFRSILDEINGGLEGWVPPVPLITASELQKHIELTRRVRTRLGLLTKPSRAVPPDNARDTQPMIYGIYVTSLQDVEQRIEQAFELYLWQRFKVHILQILMVRTDTIGSRLRKEQSLERAVQLFVSPPGDLETWGNKEATSGSNALPIDEHKSTLTLDDAIVKDMRRLLNMDPPGPKTQQRPIELLNDQLRQLKDTSQEFESLIMREYKRVLTHVIRQSTLESVNILRRYEQSLRALWENMLNTYKRLVRESRTLNELTDSFVAELLGRIEQSAVIFESYRNEAPLFAVEDRIPRAPVKRDYSLLFASESGRYVVALYEASRQLLPRDSVRDIHFLSEMPRNVVDSEMVPGRSSGGAGLPVPTRMDRVQRFFEFQSERDVGVARPDLELRGDFRTLITRVLPPPVVARPKRP